MRVLVTGGAGFIGSHVVDACIAAGHTVSVVDDLSTGKRENVHPSATLFVADMRDRKALASAFDDSRPEAVCHLAARADVRESMVEPVLYAEVNIIGSLNILEQARAHGARKVVYASSGGAVYGELAYVPADEAHPINPLDPYGASKHHVEHYLWIYRRHFGLDYSILRFGNVYGPRQDPNGEAGVVAIWTAQMLRGGRVVINGSGDQERDFNYVEDIARANVLALTRGGGETINIGSGIGTTINDLFALLKTATGYAGAPVHAPAKQGEVFRSYITNARARAVLGWAPTVSLSEGLARTVTYFRSL